MSSPFCRSLVSNGILTDQQMQQAAQAYRLGQTSDDGVIFWLIDQLGRVCDGKIMFYLDNCHRDHGRKPTWASYRLKKQHSLPPEWMLTHCLFGLHLLPTYPPPYPADPPLTGTGQPQVPATSPHPSSPIVAVVESEKTAIICSVFFPDLDGRPILWLASGGLTALTVEMLRPLMGYHIVLFPDTDPTGSAYKLWSDIAEKAGQQFGQTIYVSPILEQHATPEQKQQKADIADLLIEEHLGRK